MIIKNLTWGDILTAIEEKYPQAMRSSTTRVFGVPRGGVNIALLIQGKQWGVIVDKPSDADIIVDDLVQSGCTLSKYAEKYHKPTWCPYAVKAGEWLVFPWEQSADQDHEDIIVRMLQAVGEDPKREGLIETPKRVVKSWKQIYSGYRQKPEEHLTKVFSSDSDQMVISKNIEFYSMCEHHMMPFVGKVHVGYIPDGKVVGLSKLARTVDVFSKRLQIQEQLTEQIASSVFNLIPNVKGAGAVVEARHFCMCSRGVNKQNSSMITSSLKGNFMENEVKSEFFSFIGLK
jgi:GTP cyclohydrolase I